MLMIRVTTPGTVRATARRQGWYKIGRRTTVYKSVNQGCSFEHAAVIDRQPMESLKDW